MLKNICGSDDSKRKKKEKAKAYVCIYWNHQLFNEMIIMQEIQ